MKVASFSLNDTKGGAARAAFRLHCGVRAHGIDSRMFVREKTSDNRHVLSPTATGDILRTTIAYRIDQFPLRRYPERQALPFSTSLWQHNQLRRCEQFNPELLHLHWVNAGYIGIEDLGNARRPVVWTMHDMWPITGGCHHSEQCNRFRKDCGHCPQLGSSSDRDLSRRVIERKQRAWQKLDICWVTPSRWLAGKVSESPLARNARVEVIPNGLDTNRFAPSNKQMARKIIGLPEGRRIVLFGAVSATSNPWKGFAHLNEIVSALAAQRGDIELAVFGASSAPENTSKPSIPTHYLGSFSDELSLSLIYAAADIFIAPSTEDNLPNTVVEALSCGTPSIAFRIGGMPDMIDDGICGALIDPFDCRAFANAIGTLLAEPARLETMSRAARAKAEREFALEVASRRYIKLYEAITGANR